jgi:hypothetical protein
MGQFIMYIIYYAYIINWFCYAPCILGFIYSIVEVWQLTI